MKQLAFCLITGFSVFAFIGFAASAEAADSESGSGQWDVSVQKNGVLRVTDVDTANYLKSSKSPTKPHPSQQSLNDLLTRVRSFRIIDAGTASGKLLGDKVLFDSEKDPQSVDELKKYLVIITDPRSFGHDACYGGPTLEFICKDNQKVLIAIHHGVELRWDAWADDAWLQQPKEFITWLATKGATGPQQEMERAKAQAKFNSLESQQLRLDQFVATMPLSLRNFLGPLRVAAEERSVSFSLDDMSEKYKRISYRNRHARAIAALAKEYPSETAQIGALLTWSGSIEYPDAGVYRTFPQELLLEYRPEAILAFVTSDAVSAIQLVGAGRLYSGMGFRDLFLDGYPALNAPLQQKIMTAIKSQPDSRSDAYSFQDAIDNWMPPTRKDVILSERANLKKSK